MTDEQKLAALGAEKLALTQKIAAIKIVNLLENKQADIREIATGKLGGWGWFSLRFLKKNTECTWKDVFENDFACLHDKPPQKLRDELAKVFREHYGIEERQDDRN